jgi:hypothetical protein
MRLYFIVSSSLKIPDSIMLESVQSIVKTLDPSAMPNLYIVADHLPTSFHHFFKDIGVQNLLNTKEAILSFSTDHSNCILHFGSQIKWAKGASIYFIPLALPPAFKGLSFIKRYLLNKQFSGWMQKAHKVICLNDWSYASVKNIFPQLAAKLAYVRVPYTPVPSFEWQQLSLAKEKLTSGNDYFLCFAPQDRLVVILKEFSIFKKWQQTAMHLVVVFETEQDLALASLTLKGYKFKEDIRLISITQLKIEDVAASYTVLFGGVGFIKSSWVQNAIQYHVPLLFDELIALPDTWKKAGEVFSFAEKNALSNHFKLYYKDEIYRQSRASMGLEWLNELNQNCIPNGTLRIANFPPIGS